MKMRLFFIGLSFFEKKILILIGMGGVLILIADIPCFTGQVVGWGPIIITEMGFLFMVFGFFVFCLGCVFLRKLLLKRFYFKIAIFTILTYVVSEYSDFHYQKLRRDWFLKNGITSFIPINNSARPKITGLLPFNFETNDFSGATLYCAAWSNAGGSITVCISPRDGNYRHGYIYNPGAIIHTNPLDITDTNLVMLTNEWYLY